MKNKSTYLTSIQIFTSMILLTETCIKRFIPNLNNQYIDVSNELC